MTPPCRSFRDSGLEDSRGRAITIGKTHDLELSRLQISPAELKAFQNHLGIASSDRTKGTLALSIRDFTSALVLEPWFRRVMEWLDRENVSVYAWVPEGASRWSPGSPRRVTGWVRTWYQHVEVSALTATFLVMHMYDDREALVKLLNYAPDIISWDICHSVHLSLFVGETRAHELLGELFRQLHVKKEYHQEVLLAGRNLLVVAAKSVEGRCSGPQDKLNDDPSRVLQQLRRTLRTMPRDYDKDIALQAVRCAMAYASLLEVRYQKSTKAASKQGKIEATIGAFTSAAGTAAGAAPYVGGPAGAVVEAGGSAISQNVGRHYKEKRSKYQEGVLDIFKLFNQCVLRNAVNDSMPQHLRDANLTLSTTADLREFQRTAKDTLLVLIPSTFQVTLDEVEEPEPEPEPESIPSMDMQAYIIEVTDWQTNGGQPQSPGQSPRPMTPMTPISLDPQSPTLITRFIDRGSQSPPSRRRPRASSTGSRLDAVSMARDQSSDSAKSSPLAHTSPSPPSSSPSSPGTPGRSVKRLRREDIPDQPVFVRRLFAPIAFAPPPATADKATSMATDTLSSPMPSTSASPGTSAAGAHVPTLNVPSAADANQATSSILGLQLDSVLTPRSAPDGDDDDDGQPSLMPSINSASTDSTESFHTIPEDPWQSQESGVLQDTLLQSQGSSSNPEGSFQSQQTSSSGSSNLRRMC